MSQPMMKIECRAFASAERTAPKNSSPSTRNPIRAARSMRQQLRPGARVGGRVRGDAGSVSTAVDACGGDDIQSTLRDGGADVCRSRPTLAKDNAEASELFPGRTTPPGHVGQRAAPPTRVAVEESESPATRACASLRAQGPRP